MDILQTLLQAQGGNVVRQVASQFGLDENQASSAISALLPALAGGLQNNISQEGGIEGLLGALSNGNHQRFIDDPDQLSKPDTVEEGNGILGHILGSKDVSRQVASQAAEETGLGSSLLKQMLPVVASLAMGAISQRVGSSGLIGGQDQQSSGGGGLLGILGPMLGGGRGGGNQDVAGEVLGLVGKLFQK